jgi:hypothetical protein
MGFVDRGIELLISKANLELKPALRTDVSKVYLSNLAGFTGFFVFERLEIRQISNLGVYKGDTPLSIQGGCSDCLKAIAEGNHRVP